MVGFCGGGVLCSREVPRGGLYCMIVRLHVVVGYRVVAGYCVVTEYHAVMGYYVAEGYRVVVRVLLCGDRALWCWFREVV